jgi:NADH-quinone oxidoreductase subunit L
MEGPTPVSALIHAATMVTAGVYMVCRLGPLYRHAETALLVVAIIGTATALMAATVALVQTDIKKVLAYSTVSQLGYMFLAAGVGAFGVAVFHLFTHAFFKALLFLGSGSVIHALSGEQDMRQMGGLRKKIPWTYWTFLIGTLAIAGIPPLAGFYSKDAILLAAWQDHKPVLFGIGLLTALLTAFYMSRALFLTFFGTYRGTLEKDHGHGHADDHGHGGIHESPPSMLVPLFVLAAGSVVVGFMFRHLPETLAPVFRAQPHHGNHPAWLPILATLTAVAGIALAWYLYLVRTDLPKRLGTTFAPLARVFEAKWGFDDAYNAFARRVVVGGSEKVLWRGLDVSIIDAAVNGAAAVTARVADATRMIQSGLVRAYALMILVGAVAVLSYMLWLAP